MYSVLNVEVSCFKNYREVENPRVVNMLSWLTSGKYAEKVHRIRGIDDKDRRDQIKATLPAITPSGTFERRKEKALKKHSGFMQFDIDFQENTHIQNYDSLKRQLSHIVHVAYCGLSVSGTGYWGLVPIKYPNKHHRHFKALRNCFENLGIIIDIAPQNVASLRGYSCDRNGYFNHRARPFTELRQKQRARPTPFRAVHGGRDTQARVERLLEKINSDITAGYHNWLRLGFALESEFGESGRAYFHAISRFHPGYNRHEANRQYTHCLKHHGRGIGIGTFFYVCSLHGYTIGKKQSCEYGLKKNK